MPRFQLPLMLNSGPLLSAEVIGLGDLAIGLVPLVYVAPEYPFGALRKKLEGFVELVFTITASGSVKDIEVQRAEPHGVFEQAARRAVSRWKFKPKMQNGKAAQQRALQVIHFTLDGKR